MALQRQIASIPFIGGLQQKRDPFQIEPGKLSVLENGRFTSLNQIKTRYGYQGLSTSIINPPTGALTITNGQALMNLGNELVLCDKSNLYSYDPSGLGWNYKAPFVSAYTTLSQVVRNTYQQQAPDGNIHPNGARCFAWEDARGGSWYSIIDSTTGQVIQPSTQIHASAYKPKVLVIGNFFVIFYVRSDTTALYLGVIPASAPTTALTSTQITNATGSADFILNAVYPNYDATVFTTAAGPQLYVAFINNNATEGITTMAFGTTPANWQASTAYTVIVSVVQNGGGIYIATVSGTSAGSIGPVGTSGGTTVASGSNGQALNALTSSILHVASTTGFATAGSLMVNTSGGYKAAAYTGKTSNSFTGVTSASTATVATGGEVFIGDGTVGWRYFGAVGALTSPTVTYVVDNLAATHLGIFADTINATAGSNNGPIVGYFDGDLGAGGSQTINFIAYDMFLNPITSASVGGANAGITNITGISTGTSSRSFTIYYGVSSLGGGSSKYHTESVTFTGATFHPSAPVVFMRSVAPFAKPFLYNGTAYIPVAYQSVTPSSPGINGLQNTYFIIDQNGNTVVKALYGVGGGLPKANAAWADYDTPVLSETSSIDAVNWLVPMLQTDLLSTLSSTTPLPGTAGSTSAVYTQTGVSVANLSFFNPSYSYLRGQLANVLLIGGGLLFQYDGVNVVENGFHLFPENITTVEHSTGGTMVNGTYWYVVCYEWIDATGATQRSAPSVPFSVTVADGTNTSSVSITIPTLRVTAKTGTVSPVTIMVYRSTDIAGSPSSTFYQDISTIVPVAGGATNAPMINNPAVDSLVFVDGLPDTSIQGNAPVYTNGGVVEDIPPNSVSALAVNHNRLFALDSTNPLTIWYSKQVVPGSPVEMSEFFTLNIDPRGGPITAIAALDANLIVFKQSSIFLVVGTGPDNTGNQNDFQDAVLITTDAGCINPRSVALGPYGLYFQSSKGIYHLDRGFQVTYVGADVETTANSSTITSAQLVANTNQMRFTQGGGLNTALMLDYYVNQWGVHTPINAVDATIWQGNYTYLQPTGAAMVETPDAFTDNGSFISLKVTSSWLQFADLTGFQRLYWMDLLGHYYSPHRLNVSLAFDFAPVSQALTLTATSSDLYGQGSPYGSDSPYGGEFPLYLYRFFPNQQKMTSVQLTFQTSPIAGLPIGESVSLSGLGYLFGKKATARKPGTGSSFG